MLEIRLRSMGKSVQYRTIVGLHYPSRLSLSLIKRYAHNKTIHRAFAFRYDLL